MSLTFKLKKVFSVFLFQTCVMAFAAVSIQKHAFRYTYQQRAQSYQKQCYLCPFILWAPAPLKVPARPWRRRTSWGEQSERQMSPFVFHLMSFLSKGNKSRIKFFIKMNDNLHNDFTNDPNSLWVKWCWILFTGLTLWVRELPWKKGRAVGRMQGLDWEELGKSWIPDSWVWPVSTCSLLTNHIIYNHKRSEECLTVLEYMQMDLKEDGE